MSASNHSAASRRSNRPPQASSAVLDPNNSEPPVLKSHRNALDQARQKEPLPPASSSGSKDNQPQRRSVGSAGSTSTVPRKRKQPVQDDDDLPGLLPVIEDGDEVEVLDIDEEDAKKGVKATIDIDEFFSMEVGKDGTPGEGHRICRLCSDTTKVLVKDSTTLRRHLQYLHVSRYRTWCKGAGFVSKLPNDVKAQKAAVAVKTGVAQTQLDGHLKPLEKPFSQANFNDAAFEWVICTDQPLRALDHPTFQRMIYIASTAPKGTDVGIPSRKITRAGIMRLFKTHMNGLRTELASDSVGGDINLTCDAWQASNTDSYFAVTAHWIQEDKVAANWKLRNALIGFTRMNSSHNGKRLGAALFKTAERLGISTQIGHVTSDNASNNLTMIREFAEQYERATGEVWDGKHRHIRCLAHVINLGTQAIISTRSKSKHYDPHDPEVHLPNMLANERDELGLIRAISVKERSSSARKELFKDIQVCALALPALQLLLDMTVRWSSTYIMLNRAQRLREHVNDFVFKISFKEKEVAKRTKLQLLRVSDDEWVRVGKFCRILSYADAAQQSFSSESGPTLHNAIPALEALHAAWTRRSNELKYASFHPALEAGIAKIAQYHERTSDSAAHIIVMILHPKRKLAYFQKHWADQHGLVEEVISIVEEIYKDRYTKLNEKKMAGNLASQVRLPQKRQKLDTLLMELTDSEDEEVEVQEVADPERPWKRDFDRYLYEKEVGIPEDINPVEWWGRNHPRYGPVWKSIAMDYLSVMASSVSSERAFSSAGITISKRRSRLKGDIVEALQCLKCIFRNDLIFRKVQLCSDEQASLDGGGDEADGDGGDEEGSWDAMLIDVDDVVDSDMD